MNKELQNLCRNVLYLRRQAGLSQKEMAALLHIGISSLQKLESGTLPPKMSADVIFHLASAFGLPAAALFFPFDKE